MSTLHTVGVLVSCVIQVQPAMFTDRDRAAGMRGSEPDNSVLGARHPAEDFGATYEFNAEFSLVSKIQETIIINNSNHFGRQSCPSQRRAALAHDSGEDHGVKFRHDYRAAGVDLCEQEPLGDDTRLGERYSELD